MRLSLMALRIVWSGMLSLRTRLSGLPKDSKALRPYGCTRSKANVYSGDPNQIDLRNGGALRVPPAVPAVAGNGRVGANAYRRHVRRRDRRHWQFNSECKGH